MTTNRLIPAKPSPPKRFKVAGCTRVSEATGRQPGSLSAQISYYSRLIQSTPGWDYAGVFNDLGISGTSTRRPGYQQLMEAARCGGIDIILCKSISRLARNTVDLLATIRELSALGVSVRFERERIDTSSADEEMLVTLLASFAQEESRSLSDNVKWAIRRQYADGGTNSFWIYGYIWTGEQFTINEDEAVIVRLLFNNYLKGISPEKTATWLNDNGYASRGGGRFYGSVMRRMLENERFKRCQLLQKTYRPSIASAKRVSNTGQYPHYWVENALPAILDPEVFDQVHTEIARRREIGLAGTPSKNTGCFTSRIMCASCECNYQRKIRTYPSGTFYRFWRCWNACKGKGNPYRSHNLRESMLENLTTRILNLQEFDPDAVMDRIRVIEAHHNKLAFHLADATIRTIAINKEGRASL